MRVNTHFAEALVNAAAKVGGTNSSNYVARQVADKALHTRVGTKVVKDINVRCSARTRQHIAQTQGVDVWA